MAYDDCAECGKKVGIGDFFIRENAYCKEHKPGTN